MHPFPSLPIETERLRLRQYRVDDLAAVLAIKSRPDVVRYLPYGVRSEAEVASFLQDQIKRTELSEDGPPLYLAVETKSTGQLIGEIVLFLRSASARQGELGYVFHPDQRGKGYAFEASTAMMEIGFTHFDMHRIEARCSVANGPSWRLMERLGMRREAHFRGREVFKGAWDESYIYAILQSEWRKHTGSAPSQ